MNSQIITQTARFILLLAIQVLVLKQIGLQTGVYFSIFLYPAFILFLPRELNTVPVLLLSFLIGIAVDLFYVTPGLHAGASVFAGYARGFIMRLFEPRSGYGDAAIPSKAHLGWQWFLPAASLFMALHLFFYFSMVEFSYVYFWTILKKTIAAWVLSMAFLLMYSSIFNPKE